MRITLGPKEKKERRIGERLGIKGDRCAGPKCAAVRRAYPPGVHGSPHKKGGRRLSTFGLQLREKQKVQLVYGLSERQLRNYVRNATKTRGDTSLVLGQILERRFDNVIYRMGFARSRGEARQKVSHGHFLVNSKKVSIPSYQARVGDSISIKPASAQISFFKDVIVPRLESVETPKWLHDDRKEMSGRVIALPDADDLPANLDRKVVIEFYSR